MGKQTKFHPVSLNVLRGAAEYGGFKLGKVRQLTYEEWSNSASYKCDLVQFPPDCDLNPDKLHKTLNGLYAADVEVQLVWKTRSGNWHCILHTYSDLPFSTRQAAIERERQGQGILPLPPEEQDYA